MIRNWISSNATDKGLEQAIGMMHATQDKGDPNAVSGKQAAKNARALANRLAGGKIQRSRRR